MFLMMFGYYDMVGHQRPWHTITTPCPAGDSSWLPGQTERIRNQSTKNNDLPDLLSLPPPCFTTFSLTGVYGDIPVVMIRSLRLCLVRGQMVPSTVVLYERWESAGDWTHTGPGSVTFTSTTHHSQHHSTVQCSVERCQSRPPAPLPCMQSNQNYRNEKRGLVHFALMTLAELRKDTLL